MFPWQTQMPHKMLCCQGERRKEKMPSQKKFDSAVSWEKIIMGTMAIFPADELVFKIFPFH